MRMHDGHGGVVHWHPLVEPGILWLNTALLVLASAALQIARTRAMRKDVAGVRSSFTAGGVLTVAFLAGQLWAWRELDASGQYDAAQPAYTFFLLLTALHGLHMVGGLLVLSRTARRVWRGVDPANVVLMSRVRLSVELCTVYWHWLLLIWLGLFALLLST
jgi:cytochrome c oxidase subunit 3